MTQVAFYIIFFAAVIALIATAFSFLPLASDYPLPDGFESGLELIVDYMLAFSFIFPFDTLFDVLGYAIAFHVAIFLWKRLVWIIGVVRGVGSTGV